MRTATVWGASGGIGTALVKRLSDADWTVVSAARNPGAVTCLTSEVVEADVLRKEQRKRHVTLVRPKAVETELWEKVPFSIPHGAMEPADLAERVLEAYEEGHSGVLDL